MATLWRYGCAVVSGYVVPIHLHIFFQMKFSFHGKTNKRSHSVFSFSYDACRLLLLKFGLWPYIHPAVQ